MTAITAVAQYIQ